MISRRLLRIKVVKALYSYLKSHNDSIAKAEKELLFSINKTYDLYHYLFCFLPELQDYVESKVEIGKQKLRPTPEELKPNTKFIENVVLKNIRENAILEKFCTQNSAQIAELAPIMKKMYNNVITRDYYKTYMDSDENSYDQDKRLVIDMLTNEFEDFEDIYSLLEEQSIYWTDETEFVVGMIIRTVSNMKEKQVNEFKMLPLFKSEEDREFVKRLFRHAVFHWEEYSKCIDKFTPNWDVERIAFMDTIIMETALSEAVEFPSIPIKVTIDEYIELAKYYSTPNSSTFVNGVLDKVIQDFKGRGVIKKHGLGLLEN